MYIGLEVEHYKSFEMISDSAIDAYREKAREATVGEVAKYVIGQIDKKILSMRRNSPGRYFLSSTRMYFFLIPTGTSGRQLSLHFPWKSGGQGFRGLLCVGLRGRSVVGDQCALLREKGGG